MKCRWFIILFVVMLLCAGNLSAGTVNPRVSMQTSLGPIIIELDRQAAPKTVENFINYAETGFYDETIFHRVIKGFMIQGGGLTKDMQRKKTGQPIENEADNGLKNTRGSIAMARTMNPHSATAQFFINTADNKNLDFTSKTTQGWGYCVFGRVVSGMEIVDKIESTPTTLRAGRRDVPVETVTIESVAVIAAQ